MLKAAKLPYLLYLIVSLVLLFLIFPTLLVIPMAVGDTSYLAFPPTGFTLKWFSEFLTDPDWNAATLFSVKIAALTTLSATVMGTMASLALVRGLVWGRSTVNALAVAPLIVPQIVIAISTYMEFAPLKLTGTVLGFVLIHTVIALPYVVLTVSAALQRLDISIELAAQSLGASRWRTFVEVTLPLIAPSIAAGAIFAFLASFDEATIAFFISGVENKTVTRKLFEDIDFNLSPIVAAVSTVLLLVSLLLMGGVEIGRKLVTHSNVEGSDALAELK